MQAYFVTGDEEFYRLFCRHADFLRRCQIRSGDPKLDGAWARGYDVDKMEVFGLPNDVAGARGRSSPAGRWRRSRRACTPAS
mgnify:CR=1 FL=1